MDELEGGRFLIGSGRTRRWQGYHEGVGEFGGGRVILRVWVSWEVAGLS